MFKWKGHNILHREICKGTFMKFKILLFPNYWANLIIYIIIILLKCIYWFELCFLGERCGPWASCLSFGIYSHTIFGSWVYHLGTMCLIHLWPPSDLTFGFNIKIIFSLWICVLARPSLVFDMGIPILVYWCITMGRNLCIHDILYNLWPQG